MNPIHSRQYIIERNGRFRVEFPKNILRKRWLGSFDTLERAQEERDLFLAGRPDVRRDGQQYIIDSPVNRPIVPEPEVVVPVPQRAWNADPLTLPLDDTYLYCADLHAPGYAPTMLERLIRVGRKLKVRKLIIGGDLSDQATISQWPNITPQYSLSQCQESTGQVLTLLAGTFDEIIALPGNHDDRAAKKLGSHLSFERFLWSCISGGRFDAKLTTTDHSFLYIGDEGNGGPATGIVAGHPSFYSSIAAKGLSEVAMLQHRHVLGSHNHLIGQTWSKCGRYWAIDPGCMADMHNTPYHQRGYGISKFGAWKQGFVLLRGNIPTLLTDGWVDWRDYGA